MPDLTRRNIRSRRGVFTRPIALEPLESRLLFTVQLSLNGGVLLVQETSDLVTSATTTIQTINSSTALQVDESGETMTEDNALSNLGWTFNDELTRFSGPETGINSIVIDNDNGNDNVSIPSMNLPVTIQPRGAAEEDIDLGQSDMAIGAQAITQPITINGTNAHSIEILVDDDMDSGNIDPTVTSTSILDFAGAPINFIAPPQADSTDGLMGLNLTTGTGTSGVVLAEDPANPTRINYEFATFGRGTVGIEQLNANSTFQSDPQRADSSEEVILGNDGLITGIQGLVQIDADAGTCSLFVNDSQDTVPHTFATVDNGSFLDFKEDGVLVASVGAPATAFTLDTGPATNTVDVNLGFTSVTEFTATVQFGGTNDNISVDALSSSSALNLIGGAGVDDVSLNANSVDGPVHISNTIGLDAVTIDGSNGNTTQIISVSDSQVTGLGTGSYSLANLKSLSLIGGSAFDNFTVTPSTTVPFTIDGGPTSGTSPDRLAITTTNVTGTSLAIQTDNTGETGTYSFTNRQPINFTRFGTISPNIGDLTGTVYNEQTGAPVAGATVAVDENNNGVADGGEPTTTTDATGTFSFQGLPAGTFGILATAAGLQNPSPFTAIVAAGGLATPLMVPVIPIATAGGPDLVATIVATASGKAGLIKPKVRVKVSNLGSTMTSAAALQIVLVASTDNVLDPTDPQLLTTSTPPVLLKANKSKSFTLTGATPTSLTAGSYFVIASVDSANAVAESNEANNVAASTNMVTLAPPVVDLTGKFGHLPKTASTSKVLPVSFMLQNLGTVPATGTIDFDFFASTDTTLDNSDISLGTGFPVVAHVAAGKSQPVKFKLSLGSSLPAGSYHLVARVNSTSSIAESDSSNNVVFSTMPILIS